MEILPPSDEGGGQRKALDGGREKQYYLHYFKIVLFLSISLPQSASLTAPSSEGAKIIRYLFRQAEAFLKACRGAGGKAPAKELLF